LYDGVSITTLLSEVETLALGKNLQLAPTFHSFLEEALLLPKDTETFWKLHLRGFQPLHILPEQRYLEIMQNGVVSHVSKPAIAPLSSIEARLRELGVSLLSLCQASWATTLSAALKTSDICFGNVVSGRSIPMEGIDRLVAPCFNTIPIRIKLPDLTSNRDLMKGCQQLSADMLPYHLTSLRKIQSLSGANDAQLFDTVLLLQPPSQPLNEAIWSLEWDHGSMDVSTDNSFETVQLLI
jgi:hypothetical protein